MFDGSQGSFREKMFVLLLFGYTKKSVMIIWCPLAALTLFMLFLLKGERFLEQVASYSSSRSLQ